MKVQLEQIREQQKLSWNKFSAGWKKWDDFNMDFLRPMGELIISKLQLKDTAVVLDIATGTGEPGLSMAAQLSSGKVIGIDTADEMLTIARANADAKGIKNYETLVADICELPLGNETFDAISCRMGFMFFPDMQLAAHEMYRVLKPGGKIAIAVWGLPESNNWITTIMSVIQKYVSLPPAAPDMPGMFRCSKPGLIAQLLINAGFNNVLEQGTHDNVDYQSFDRYWEIMMDVGAPIVAAMSGADEATRNLIKKDTAAAFQAKNTDSNARLEYAAVIISAEK